MTAALRDWDGDNPFAEGGVVAGPTGAADVPRPVRVESVVLIQGLDERDRALLAEVRAMVRAELDDWLAAYEERHGDDLLWSLDTTAAKLSVSKRYVQELAADGKLPARYQGRRPFFEAAAVRAYAASLPTEAP